ncbi:TPA: helix-turn-helix domain-containing protein [Yersinia enterocolitica]|nr:helix-turn-helix domain-containing protein [Yersinia enterocolitica]KGA78686.1 helix-turn-helix domain protein [Yersinia enterocolitica]HDL6510098.1 helix-turn-helix domain-containing protein [Yersinia enterocolitica]HDL7604531.1 helix-turn-helix domain-containing protein [Yersinia enterocolitica]HDL7612550.1 helix-turn-helix domain-containing protein [Yersinia enterocolitica]HDL7641185.1 helix-turn-helix domain-containing protein [Yersinia enterocolitica]
MSLETYNWAINVRVGNAAAKSVLKVLADRAGADHLAFPSIASIVFDTELDKKTVQKHLHYLADKGLIEDSGERRGATRRVIVWRLVGVPDRTGDREYTQKPDYFANQPPARILPKGHNNRPKNGNIPQSGYIPPSNSPKNGSVETGEMIPLLDGNDPKNGIRNLSGTYKDLKPLPPIIPQGGKSPKKFDPLSIPIPDWLNVTAWMEWVQYRKQSNKPIKTPLSVTKAFNLLKDCLDDGHDPTEVINISIANGYQGLFKPRYSNRPAMQAAPPLNWDNVDWADSLGGLI